MSITQRIGLGGMTVGCVILAVSGAWGSAAITAGFLGVLLLLFGSP